MFNIHFVNKGQILCAYLAKLPIYDPKPLLPNINSYTKFEEIGHKLFNIVLETNFQHKSRAMTLCIVNKIYPSTILNHSFPISTIKQIFEENWSENAQDRERTRKYSRPLVFTIAKGCRASEIFDISSANYCSPYMPIIFVMQAKCLF